MNCPSQSNQQTLLAFGAYKTHPSQSSEPKRSERKYQSKLLLLWRKQLKWTAVDDCVFQMVGFLCFKVIHSCHFCCGHHGHVTHVLLCTIHHIFLELKICRWVHPPPPNAKSFHRLCEVMPGSQYRVQQQHHVALPYVLAPQITQKLKLPMGGVKTGTGEPATGMLTGTFCYTRSEAAG